MLVHIMALTVADVTVEGILPLKIGPKDGNTSTEYLKKWIAVNKEWLDQKLLEHGKHFERIQAVFKLALMSK